MTGLITKFLGSPEEIHGWDHSTHLHRWTIFRNKRLQVFLDHTDIQDWYGNFHNYPERFISVGLAQSEANGIQVFRDRAAWMLLFGRASLGARSQVSCVYPVVESEPTSRQPIPSI
jgi:hypothetical protein